MKRTVLIVVSLNILQLFVYPQFWSWTSLSWPTGFSGDKASVDVEEPQLKSWPAIPSHRPWTLNKDLQTFSCEAYFGNGYTDVVPLLKAPKKSKRLNNTDDLSGSFQCRYNPTLRTSICEGKHVVMNLDKIEMSKGGEYLEKVIGRGEDAELPQFSTGAFEVMVTQGSQIPPATPLFDNGQVDSLMPQGQVSRHTLRDLLKTVRTVDASTVTCARVRYMFPISSRL